MSLISGDDAISRKVVLDKIKEVCFSREQKWVDFRVSYGSNGQRDLIIKFIESLPNIQPRSSISENPNKWISVSERLPHTYGIYIVTRRISDGFECRNITDACYFDGSNTWYDDTRINFERKYLTDVLAWMPLPEPYKESRN